MNHSLNQFEKPSCVLLDLDNTIYEYAPAHDKALKAATLEASSKLNIAGRDFRNCYAQARLQIKERLGSVAASHSRLLYFQRTLELIGLGSQPMYALTLEQTYWQNFLADTKLFSEVEELLDDLRIAGIPVVVITDLTAAIQIRKFIFWGLDRYIDWLVTSEESGRDKPDISIFELALAKLGGVEGSVWMIGDDSKKDIDGAKQAINATTFLRKTRMAGMMNPDADYVFEKFGELRQILRDTV